MNRFEKNKIRKNTTLVSIVTPIILGLILCLYANSLELGFAIKILCLVGSWGTGCLFGILTWYYETRKHDL